MRSPKGRPELTWMGKDMALGLDFTFRFSRRIIRP